MLTVRNTCGARCICFFLFPQSSSICNLRLFATDKNYYDVLGVSSSATTAEIKSAFYQKSKELHPDNLSNDQNDTAAFVELKKAYDVLRRPADRAAYDNRSNHDYHSMYGSSYRPGYGPHYDFNNAEWTQFWRNDPRRTYSQSEMKKKSQEQWKWIWRWTAVGAFIVVLYNVGYVLQIRYRNHQISKLVDEDEIAKSFLRQSEFKERVTDDMEEHVTSLGKILKGDVDEAWRRRQEELVGRNPDEIREEYRWFRAVQDYDHTRRIKAKRAELKRREIEARWGRRSSLDSKEPSGSDLS